MSNATPKEAFLSEASKMSKATPKGAFLSEAGKMSKAKRVNEAVYSF